MCPQASSSASTACFKLPAVDTFSYRLITLENGLQALLIHDPAADKAAAACDVSTSPP
jgi:insulysin